MVADVFTSNGVIHAVNKVLAPQSIVDFATKAEGLSILTTNLVDAGLVSTLSSDGPFTVFAPANSAFEAIEDVVRGLTPEQVASVLTYHVVPGINLRINVLSNPMHPGGGGPTVGTIAMLNGETFVLSLDGNKSIIRTGSGQDVGIDAFDIQGTNGIIHLVGTVLIPENL